MSVYMHEQWTHAKCSRYTIDYQAIKWIYTTIFCTYTVSKVSLYWTFSLCFWRWYEKQSTSAIDYDITITIELIECNAKCRYLNKLTCKGTFRQVFYLSEAPSPFMTSYTSPLTHIFSNRSLQSLVHKFKSNEGQYTFTSCPLEWSCKVTTTILHISISYDRLFKRWLEVGERMLKCR